MTVSGTRDALSFSFWKKWGTWSGAREHLGSGKKRDRKNNWHAQKTTTPTHTKQNYYKTQQEDL